MSEIIYIINAPALSLHKSDLYSSEFVNNSLNSFIKSISDSFFLSNNFREHYTVYFFTEIEGEKYQIIFKGKELRFLGPSFFSAGHLLLRAKNHILEPGSKKGKLTPGISIQKRDMKSIIERYKEGKWFHIESLKDAEKHTELNLVTDTNIFLFGFESSSEFNVQMTKLTVGPIEIDEQIIITNYRIESVK